MRGGAGIWLAGCALAFSVLALVSPDVRAVLARLHPSPVGDANQLSLDKDPALGSSFPLALPPPTSLAGD